MCGADKARTEFSKAQLKKAGDVKKCVSCVADSEGDAGATADVHVSKEEEMQPGPKCWACGRQQQDHSPAENKKCRARIREVENRKRRQKQGQDDDENPGEERVESDDDVSGF